jgi:hypothetical protein
MNPARIAIGLAVAVTAVGCAHATSAVGPGSSAHESSATTSGSAQTVATPSHAKAAVAGRFRIVGGPYPGINHPLSGTIEVHVRSLRGPVAARVKAVDGTFAVRLAPGAYVFAGKSGQLTGDGPGCSSDRPVSIRSGRTNLITVQCDVP